MKKQPPTHLPNNSNETKSAALDAIDIASIGKNLWRISTTFTPKEHSKDTIPLKLREIKKKIAFRFNHPESLLRYLHLNKKEVLSDGNIHIEFEIERLPIPTGSPNVALESIVSDTGDEYTNMICRIDLFPLDNYDRRLDLELVKGTLQQQGIEKKLVQWDILEKHIQRIVETQIPMHRIEIARGTVPTKGKDAELEFTFPTHPQQGMTRNYIQSRKVKCGDILCVKKPPTIGDEPGVSVKGKELPPRKGWDVKLVAGKGTSLSTEGTEVISQADGLVTANRKEIPIYATEGRKIVPVEIALQVEPLLVLSGKQREILTTDDPIEVAGSLMDNSHLISRNEIHVRGDVHKGSQIQASHDITIGGNINQGSLTSDGSITSDGKVSDSKITAKGKIALVGPVMHSEVQGSEIDLGEVMGSNIHAQHRVTVERIGAGKEGRISQINIGRISFLNDKIRQYDNFIKSANQNLKRLYKLFERETLEDLEPSERSRILMLHLSARKITGKRPYTANEVDALKQLLDSVSTLKRLIQEKQEDIQRLKQQLTETDDTAKMLIVKERVTAKTLVTIGNYQTELEPTESGVCVRTGEQGLSVESLPGGLESIDALLTVFENQEQLATPSEKPTVETNGIDQVEKQLAKQIVDSTPLKTNGLK